MKHLRPLLALVLVLLLLTGCGGELQYNEMDIGTTGAKIIRGAARLVYAQQDKNGNGIYEATSSTPTSTTTISGSI